MGIEKLISIYFSLRPLSSFKLTGNTDGVGDVSNSSGLYLEGQKQFKRIDVESISSRASLRNYGALVELLNRSQQLLSIHVLLEDRSCILLLKMNHRGVQGEVSLQSLPSLQTTYNRTFGGTSLGGFYLLSRLLCTLTGQSF